MSPVQHTWCPRHVDMPERFKGKGLASQPLQAGRTPDVFFDNKIRSLADGDQYLDPARVEKEIDAMVGGTAVTEKAFFPPQGTKKRCALSYVMEL